MGLTKQQMVMVSVMVLGAFVAVLNQTLLTPALPTIMDHLSVSATTAQWLTSGYSLLEAIIIPLNAYFLGRFRTRRLFVFGMGLFTAGSALCAVAPNFPALMMGRLVQASATGVLMPSVFSLILLVFPRESRGTAMGLIGLVVSFAPAIGPSISGVLVDAVGWRFLFVLVSCLAAVIAVASAFAMRNFEGFLRTTFDVPSVVLLASGMFCLLYGLSTFTTGNMTVALVLMAAGVVLLGLFARRQLGLEAPLLRVQVFRHREFRIACIVILFMEAVLISSGVILPIFIQNGLGQSATTSGVLMFPGAAIGAVCGLLAGRVFDKRGVRGIAIGGGLVLMAGVCGYFLCTPDASVIVVGAVYAVACIGIQMLITPINTWGLNSLPNEEISHGNAIVSTTEQIGASLGTAFAVSLTALRWLVEPADASAAQQAFGGCHLAFLGIFGLSVVVAVVIVFFVRDRKKAVPLAQAVGVPGEPGMDRAWLVADVMNAQADRLPANATVGQAIDIMQRTETSGLPIVASDGWVAGFISDGDILKSLSIHQTSRAESDAYVLLRQSESVQERLVSIIDKPALDLATRKVVVVQASEPAESAFRTLSERRIKKVPVVDAGAFVGTLSRSNMMKALARLEPQGRG